MHMTTHTIRTGLVLKLILKKLHRAQSRLLRTANAFPADLWRTSPRQGVWSAAELIAHLITVERVVVRAADRIFQKQPKQILLLKRFHLPLSLVEMRLYRVKTPIATDPQLLDEKEAMLAELREVWGRTLAFIEETRNRDLSAYRWKHPFVGSLNGYEWFSFLASHQIRHEKQMRKIAASLNDTMAEARRYLNSDRRNP
jgi:DinB superfamily